MIFKQIVRALVDSSRIMKSNVNKLKKIKWIHSSNWGEGRGKFNHFIHIQPAKFIFLKKFHGK